MAVIGILALIILVSFLIAIACTPLIIAAYTVDKKEDKTLYWVGAILMTIALIVGTIIVRAFPIIGGPLLVFGFWGGLAIMLLVK